jgi:hypothetical protein
VKKPPPPPPRRYAMATDGQHPSDMVTICISMQRGERDRIDQRAAVAGKNRSRFMTDVALGIDTLDSKEAP